MEQRKARRFQLELPLSIIRTGSVRTALAGKTKNISSTGVLFTSIIGPDLGGPIEYVITLSHEGPEPVQLRCVGKVMRTIATDPRMEREDCVYEIAATLERYEFVRQHPRMAVA